MEKETKTATAVTPDATFENLEIWREAVALAGSVYRTFRSCRDFAFRDQIPRAAVSISSNIAEGYERSSNPDFIRFLDIARGSCGEVRSQLHVAVEVKLVEESLVAPLVVDATRFSKRIARLMTVRREKFV
jgi:four helix bundle protein